MADQGDDTGMPSGRASQPNRSPPKYRTLLLNHDGGVATITLNRPGQRDAVGDVMRDPTS
jgi:hypothetical protein